MNEKVLIINNNQSAIDMLVAVLNQSGYQVMSSNAYEEGLEKARNFQPEVAIVDIVMPDMSGFEICRSFRKEPALKNCKLVLITEQVDVIDPVRAKNCGADELIIKVQDSALLLRTVKRLLGKTRILIINSSSSVASILKSLLEEQSYKTALATTGELGVKEAISSRPDLVIIDTLLPDIDGFEVCRQIRNAGGPEKPKIMMITGSIDAIDAVKARKMGADEYVVKTQDFSIMIESVKKLA